MSGRAYCGLSAGICATEGCQLSRTGKSKYCRDHRDEARKVWLARIDESAKAKSDREDLFVETFNRAWEAGLKAGRGATPTPMVVQQHASPVDDSSPVVESWRIDGGVCGFAWVSIRPGTSSFAKWLVKYGHAKPDSYAGGVTIWISEFGQSMERKVACATALAEVIRKTSGLGNISVYANSRMD